MDITKTLSRRKALALAAGSLAAGLCLFPSGVGAWPSKVTMKFNFDGRDLDSVVLPDKVVEVLNDKKAVEGKLYDGSKAISSAFTLKIDR